MGTVKTAILTALALLAAAPAGHAAEAPAVPATPSAVTPASAPRRLLAGTVVDIELTDRVSSSTARIGDKFGLRLTQPITVDGIVVAPAGAKGGGVVIDAGEGGIAGRPGKLVLAARYIDDMGVHIPLRGFKVSGSGRDNGTLSLVASEAVGVIGVMIPGGNITFPAGFQAIAKVAADTDLSPSPSSEPKS